MFCNDTGRWAAVDDALAVDLCCCCFLFCLNVSHWSGGEAWVALGIDALSSFFSYWTWFVRPMQSSNREDRARGSHVTTEPLTCARHPSVGRQRASPWGSAASRELTYPSHVVGWPPPGFRFSSAGGELATNITSRGLLKNSCGTRCKCPHVRKGHLSFTQIYIWNIKLIQRFKVGIFAMGLTDNGQVMLLMLVASSV